MDECKFCGCGKRAIAIMRNNEEVNRKVYENDDFYVMISVGALVEGHMLIIPRYHCLSMGNLSEEHMKGLVNLIEKIKMLLKKHYGKEVIVFEHGTGRDSQYSSASVVHAHIHLVPVEEGLYEDLKALKCSIERLDSYNDLKKVNMTGKSYLLYQDVDNKLYLINDSEMPSQFFRKVICDKFNLGEWNWRKDYKEENIIRTVETCKDFDWS